MVAKVDPVVSLGIKSSVGAVSQNEMWDFAYLPATITTRESSSSAVSEGDAETSFSTNAFSSQDMMFWGSC